MIAQEMIQYQLVYQSYLAGLLNYKKVEITGLKIPHLNNDLPVTLTSSPFGQQTCSVALWNQLCKLSGPAVVLHHSVISSPLFSVTLLAGLILENPTGDTRERKG